MNKKREEKKNHSWHQSSSVMMMAEEMTLTPPEPEAEPPQPEPEPEPLEVVSILNLVVDHVMSQPTPFEPEEYKWLCFRQLQKQKQKQNGETIRKTNTHTTANPCRIISDSALPFDGDYNTDNDVVNDNGINMLDDGDDDVQVPVIRIFGPIVKGRKLLKEQEEDGCQQEFATYTDHHTKNTAQSKAATSNQNDRERGHQYHQSGCLHIHGAYPYLLARPVEAGPDGSSFFFRTDPLSNDSCHNQNNKDFDYDDEEEKEDNVIDWDNQESVTNIVEDIHVQLESVLQSSVEDYRDRYDKNNDENNNNNNNNATRKYHPTKTQAKDNHSDGGGINRKTMTMKQAEVKVAPTRFIRKITVVRGRGFYTYCIGTAAPFLKIEYYNPAHRWRVKAMLERGLEMPMTYHPGGFGGGESRKQTDEFAKDAMQVLKFRCYEAHIPYTMQFFKDWNLAGMAWIDVGDVRFRNPLPRAGKMRYSVENDTRHSTAAILYNYLLLQGTVPSKFKWGESMKQSKIGSDSGNRYNVDDEFWKRKETSCDVELDIRVSDILNVNDVMTQLPSQSEINIHWRAVPSLREIWAEERQRMAVLLPPKDNFLSDDNENLSFTLSVKKGAPVPGSRLALNGNRRLFDPSPTLASDYRRAMIDILKKYESMFKGIDSRLTVQNARAKREIQTFHQKKKELTLSDVLSQKDEALDALENLFGQFSHSSQRGTPTKVQRSPEGSGDAITQNECNFVSSFLTPIKSMQLSQYVPQTPLLTQLDLKEVQDNLEYCMEVDRNFVSNGEIDPSSLTPFDDLLDQDNVLDEEEDMDEEELEKSLTALATQKLTPMNEPVSQLDAVVNNWKDPVSKQMFDEFALGQDSISSTEQIKSLSPNIKENDFSTPPMKRSVLSLLSIDSPSTSVSQDEFLELKRRPPLQECFRDLSPIHLHPNNKNQMSPVPWMGFVSNSDRNTHLTCGYDCVRGFFLQPVAPPPSCRKVRKWVERERRKHKPRDTKEIQSKHTEGRSGHKKDDLQFDANSRKMLRRVENPKKKRKRRVVFSDEISSSKACVVEEVPWMDESQSLTQESSDTLSLGKSDSKGVMLDVSSQTNKNEPRDSGSHTPLTQTSPFTSHSDSPRVNDPLLGIGLQGGKIYVEGGSLKASVTQDMSRQPKKLSMMSIEVHVQCRTGKAGVTNSTEISMKPDPTRDPISAVFYVYAFDPGGGEQIDIKERGCVFVPTENETPSFKSSNYSGDIQCLTSKIGKTMGIHSRMKLEAISNEEQLLLRLSSIVQWKDPDVLMSWDTQGEGLGYLVERGLVLGRNQGDDTADVRKVDMVRLLGRTPKTNGDSNGDVQGSNENKKFTGSVLGADWDDRVGAGAGPSSIVGRLILNGWKIMSEEVKHPNASYLQAMVATVLKKRIPFHNDLLLTKWYGAKKGINRWRVIRYRIIQTVSTVLLFDALDVIGRAGEAARLSGVEFSQSFPGIRGSQYKVEGVVLRSLQSLVTDRQGKERNYFFFSPSKNDTANQEALECQAMTLEPKSGFHFDPVVVCDFTALYPSLVIAYNLCYSTIAGKLEYHSTREEMRKKGSTTQKLGPFDYHEARTAFVLKQHMKSLTSKDKKESDEDKVYCMPTGSIFVSEDIMQGVLPSLLDEMLSTRAMLKKAAKIYRKHLPNPPAAVLRQLEARQLALKYVANVTYGYTSATFSGRSAMPLLADTIVECGRRTLSNAIALATKWGTNRNSKYFGAEVVYGDTDSLFIKLPGRSVKEAFAFGKEFCEAVTLSNPPPVQLKLEKVYSGTLLQTKKKYCGMKYDSPDQKVPSFEAKGIETIRRDQCTLTQKILRNALVTVFRDRGVQNLQDYLCRQWTLIHAGRLPVSDFILTGRVRSQYRGKKVGPVQAALARRLAESDPGINIRHKERLAYVIVASPGRNFKLRDCVLTPNELLAQWDCYTTHAAYYATKHVNAALNRCFGLAPWKINIHTWYDAFPKPQKRFHHWPLTRTGGSPMISAYFGSDQCAICAQKCKTDGNAKAVICRNCKKNRGSATFLAAQTLNLVQQRANQLASRCQKCNGCFESSGTFAKEKARSRSTSLNAGLESPIANCTCIDCPVTYKRHEMRESEIEALALCKALQVFNDW